MNEQDSSKIAVKNAQEKLTVEQRKKITTALGNLKKVSGAKGKSSLSLDDFLQRWYANVSCGSYTLEQIKEAKANGNIDRMREISKSFFITSSNYKRILTYFSQLFKYYYTLDLKGISDYIGEQETESSFATGGIENKRSKIKKMYSDCLSILDGMNLESTLGQISVSVLTQGVYFGCVTTFPDNKKVLTQLPPSCCRTRYTSSYGTKIVEINASALGTYYKSIQSLPTPILKAIEKNSLSLDLQQYDGDEAILKELGWVSLAPEEGCCFFIEENFAPPFYDTIIDIVNYDDYKDLEKAKDTQKLKKILIQSFELDENGDLDVLLEEMAAIHEGTCNMLADSPEIEILTTIANVKMEDMQETSSVNDSLLEKMLTPKYESAGVSFELFASTTATSLELSISNSTSFMSQLVHQYEAWLSLQCYSKVVNKIVPIVTILPITWYNDKKMMEIYTNAAQYGYSFITPYVASGKKQSTLLDTKMLENDILGLNEILLPLKSSFTQSGNEASFSEGRPVSDPEDRSEKTNERINGL